MQHLRLVIWQKVNDASAHSTVFMSVHIAFVWRMVWCHVCTHIFFVCCMLYECALVSFDMFVERYATVGGGYRNSALGFGSVVSGGSGPGTDGWNVAFADWSCIAGGTDNFAGGAFTAIGGGKSNNAKRAYVVNCCRFLSLLNQALRALLRYRFGIITPPWNVVYDGCCIRYSLVAGGFSNTAGQTFSVVAGGTLNLAEGHYAAVVGGKANMANTGATVAGGHWNSASGFGSFVGGGGAFPVPDNDSTLGNKASGFVAAAVGGMANQATGNFSFIGGGYRNTAAAFGAVIGGGGGDLVGGPGGHKALGRFSSVLGGEGNLANSDYASAGGGYGNRALLDFSVVAGGNVNTVGGTLEL